MTMKLERIRAALHEAPGTPADLSARTGIPPGTISALLSWDKKRGRVYACGRDGARTVLAILPDAEWALVQARELVSQARELAVEAGADPAAVVPDHSATPAAEPREPDIATARRVLESAGYGVITTDTDASPRRVNLHNAGLALFRHLSGLAGGPDGLRSMARAQDVSASRLGRLTMALGEALHGESEWP
ncbi:MAG: hypothetical protein RLO11_00075 [Salinisphaeraceae bacterium]